MNKNIKLVSLENVSQHIVTGLVLSRKKLKVGNGFKYKVFTLKSFNENGYIDREFLDDFITKEKIDNKQISKEGDIIIRLSYPNTAVYITKELEGIVVPSLFVSIRINDKCILPEFVQIYLNSDNCKRNITADIVGSAVYVLKASSIRQIKIPVCEIKYQNKIIKMNHLIMKEKVLLNELLQEKARYHKQIIKNMFEQF